MCEEEYRLRATGTYVEVGEVVATADEAGLGGTDVVAWEVRINETCAFYGLLVFRISCYRTRKVAIRRGDKVIF